MNTPFPVDAISVNWEKQPWKYIKPKMALERYERKRFSAFLRSGVFKRRPKKPRPPKAPRRPAPTVNDEYDDFDDVAYADTEMPDRRRMRIPEAMRQMERPEMGGEAT